MVLVARFFAIYFQKSNQTHGSFNYIFVHFANFDDVLQNKSPTVVILLELSRAVKYCQPISHSDVFTCGNQIQSSVMVAKIPLVKIP